MGAIRNAYKILVRKSEQKTLLARARYIWENNIRIDLKETGRKSMDWMHLAQDRDQWQVLVNPVMNLQVPYKVGNLTSSPTGTLQHRIS
jgi:hypothetical protein